MQTYKVIGRNAIDGVPTGGTVSLSDEDAERLIAGGHVESIAARTKTSTTSIESSEEK